jgi:asparagine synthase (glutamine-hydrolysing)
MFPDKFRLNLMLAKNNYLIKDFVKDNFAETYLVNHILDSNSLNESFINHFEYKLEHLLKWEDRNSMWFSLESRLPFLDYRLVEKTLASIPSLKINNGMTKVILREAMKDILPEKIRLRKDKVGFGTPLNDWIREPKWQLFINEIFSSDSFKSRRIADVSKVKKLYNKHLSNKANASKDIWKLLHLELWYRMFID